MSARSALMWEGQRAFRSLAQADARELLGQLDAEVTPTVVLVGIRADDDGDLPEVVVEPTGHEALSALLSGAADAARAAPTPATPTGLAASAPLAVEGGESVLYGALQRTVEARLERPAGEDAPVSFCAAPRRVGAYLVCTVVQIDRDAYAAHAGAAAGGRGALAERRVGSLLDATVNEFLDECSFALSQPELGRYGVVTHEIPDLLRAAGKKVMYGPGSHMHGMMDLYDICNMISTMRYEGSDSAGSMLVAPHGADDVTVALALARPVSLRDYRSVRKLLEITGDGLMLLCAAGDVYGLGAGRDEGATRGHFVIGFTGHHAWRLELDGRVLMEVRYGQPRVPKERIDAVEFRRQVAQTFAQIDAAEIATLWGLVSEAANQRHGTMVVVTTGAEAEAARLGTQGISVEPTPLTPELMRQVTAIDGAVLIDAHNVCHAIGTILDGLATDAGDPSRGARFNSAIRYVRSTEHACLAIVVSEDGMIDVVSNG